MIFWERQNYGDCKSVVVWVWGGRVERKVEKAMKPFQGSESILYNNLMVDNAIINLYKPTECTTPRQNPNVNYRLSENYLSV